MKILTSNEGKGRQIEDKSVLYPRPGVRTVPKQPEAPPTEEKKNDEETDDKAVKSE